MNNLTIAVSGGLAGMLGYSISDFLAKKTIDRIGAPKTLIFSQLIGAFLLLTYFVGDRSLPEFTLANLGKVLLFGLANAVGYLSLYKAFELGKLSIVSPISSSYTILAAVVSFRFFGETFTTFKILLLILVSIGIVLTAINLKELRDGLDWRDLSRGVPQALMVFVIFGVYVPLWDKFLEGEGWLIWAVLVKLILVSSLSLFYGGLKKVSLGVGGLNIWGWLFWVSLFEAIASFGNSWALHASANTTSIVSALTSSYPLITTILAYVFLKERLAVNQYLGIAFILSGMALLPFV